MVSQLHVSLESNVLTDLHAPPSKPKSRQHHLTKSEARAECTEIAHWDDAQQIEEEARQYGIDKAKEEYAVRKQSKCK